MAAALEMPWRAIRASPRPRNPGRCPCKQDHRFRGNGTGNERPSDTSDSQERLPGLCGYCPADIISSG